MNLFWSPLSLPSPRKAGRGWPKAGRGVWFMGSLLSFFRMHWDHEPATDRSADSLSASSLELIHADMAVRAPIGGSWRGEKLDVNRRHERWGETPSSPNFYPWEIRARRSLAPPGSCQVAQFRQGKKKPANGRLLITEHSSWV